MSWPTSLANPAMVTTCFEFTAAETRCAASGPNLTQLSGTTMAQVPCILSNVFSGQ